MTAPASARRAPIALSACTVQPAPVGPPPGGSCGRSRPYPAFSPTRPLRSTTTGRDLCQCFVMNRHAGRSVEHTISSTSTPSSASLSGKRAEGNDRGALAASPMAGTTIVSGASSRSKDGSRPAGASLTSRAHSSKLSGILPVSSGSRYLSGFALVVQHRAEVHDDDFSVPLRFSVAVPDADRHVSEEQSVMLREGHHVDQPARPATLRARR